MTFLAGFLAGTAVWPILCCVVFLLVMRGPKPREIESRVWRDAREAAGR